MYKVCRLNNVHNFFCSNKEFKSTKSLFEKLCTHITHYNENIEKVKKSKLLLPMDSNDK